jgi:ribosome-binding protein aMBF1 (putative translation factor)
VIAMPTNPLLDTSLHGRRRTRRMRDPEYRQAYERAAREIAQTDQVIRELDMLRVDLGISKAELARRIDRNASSIRRLFTASHARPELPLVAAIADALGAEVRVVAKRQTARGASKASTGRKRTRVAA